MWLHLRGLRFFKLPLRDFAEELVGKDLCKYE